MPECLPTCSAQKKDDDEEARLRLLYPSSIQDVMMYRFGYVPPLVAIRQPVVQKAIPTIRPGNKYYSMVESAKRTKIHYDERERLRQIARANDIHPRPEWRPPQPITILPRANGPSYIRKIDSAIRPRFINMRW